MTKLKNQYHHGDLTQSLLNEAASIIKTSGTEALSMRKLADQVGVSRTAPYHHFKDKNALLCALAETGFKSQKQQLSDVISQLEVSHESFKKYVYQYLDYAKLNSETYDLMFGRAIWKAGTPTESLREASKQTFKLWLTWVEELQKKGVLPNNNTPLRTGQATWAGLHGLARLMIDGVYLDQTDQKPMIDQMIQMLCTKENALN
ncbi:TetR/AcrR family transcriptional regulator [Marinomonas epiphytica]